jgi:hypothetical protein
MDPRIGWRRMDWIIVAHDIDYMLAVVDTVMNLWIP